MVVDVAQTEQGANNDDEGADTGRLGHGAG